MLRCGFEKRTIGQEGDLTGSNPLHHCDSGNQDGDGLADMSRRCIFSRRTGPLMLSVLIAGPVDGVVEESAKFTDERDLS